MSIRNIVNTKTFENAQNVANMAYVSHDGWGHRGNARKTVRHITLLMCEPNLLHIPKYPSAAAVSGNLGTAEVHVV